MMNEVIVLGAAGQIGGEIQRLFPGATFLTRLDCDLSSLDDIEAFFKVRKPRMIINCSGYTAVDLAEVNIDLARKINSQAPAALAQFSEKFIHFSTDYVFNGTGFRPYSEKDTPDPINIYGATKLEGERAILRANPNAVIIRTSWVYSDIGKNFVKTILKLGSEKRELRVVADQIGSPTYARDLGVLVVENAIKKWNFGSGIYHFSNEGVASWYDFAREIMETSSLKCRVLPIRSEEFPTSAKRPFYSVLDKSKIKKDLNIEIPHWKESLNLCLQKLS